MNTPGQRFGETRSGKPICTYLTDDLVERTQLINNFSAEDNFDALALFQHLLRREFRRATVESEFSRICESWSDLHEEQISSIELGRLRASLSMITSLDVVEHGKNRADRLFRD